MKYRRVIAVAACVASVAALGAPVVFGADLWDGSSGEVPDRGWVHSTLPAISGPIVPFTNPWLLIGDLVSVNFEDALPGECVNSKYVGMGMAFERDDGRCVPAFDWERLNRQTTSPPMVMGTICPGCWTTHLNVLVLGNDVHTFGAFYGNDQKPNMHWLIEAFDHNDQAIGHAVFVSNGNTHIDEFIGISSRVPFGRIRITQVSSSWYSVVLDNVTLSSRAVIVDPVPPTAPLFRD